MKAPMISELRLKLYIRLVLFTADEIWIRS